MEHEHEVTIFMVLRFLDLYEACTVFESQDDDGNGNDRSLIPPHLDFTSKTPRRAELRFNGFPNDSIHGTRSRSSTPRLLVESLGALTETSSVFTTGSSLGGF